MNTKTIKIVEEFSRYPAGRFIDDGPFSGEKFREEFIKPLLDDNVIITIDLNGTRGYGSSFLEEVFGGLVRNGYSMDFLLTNISFISDDKSLVLEINQYIKDASDEF